MMPSRVLSYIQLGHFLMLVMSVSWAFSTFFFQSLCSIAGPQGNFGQLSFSPLCKKKSSSNVFEELQPLKETSRADNSKGLCDEKRTSQEYLSGTDLPYEKTTSQENLFGKDEVHEKEGRSVKICNLTNLQPDGNGEEDCQSLSVVEIGDKDRNFVQDEAKNTSDTNLLVGKDEHNNKSDPGEAKTEDKGRHQEVAKNDSVTCAVPLLIESTV